MRFERGAVLSHVDIWRKNSTKRKMLVQKATMEIYIHVWQSSVSEYGAMCEGRSRKRSDLGSK